MHTFERPNLPDFQTRITREPVSPYRADIVVHLPHFTSIDTAATQLTQSPEDSPIDPTEDHLSQSLDSPQTDSADDSLDTLLPDAPIEMEPVQLMNQLLTQLTMKAVD